MQLGLAESARATTAAESRFRIEYPNSRARRSRVISLDQDSNAMLRRLAEKDVRPGARFLHYVEATAASVSLHMLPVDAALLDADGRRVSLFEEIKDADIVVMVCQAGASAEAAEIVGNACLVHSKMPTGLILNATDAAPEDLTRTLVAFRPFAKMLVVSSGEEYVTEMLNALRV